MWKKPESSEPASAADHPVESAATARTARAKGGASAMIGSSIAVKGDISGGEDLLIQGQVEGNVQLADHSVTVGADGRVKADIHARNITVEGQVEGGLYGSEKVVIRQSGRVRGNIVSPRVTLEDGASFKGSIDMEVQKSPRPSPESVASASAGPAAGKGAEKQLQMPTEAKKS
jgi:cytoskeletal protein CcmA (bactofilin family)